LLHFGNILLFYIALTSTDEDLADSHSHAAISSAFCVREQKSVSAMSLQRKIDVAFSILAWLLRSAKVVDALTDRTEAAIV
jgi:hypothetical protein